MITSHSPNRSAFSRTIRWAVFVVANVFVVISAASCSSTKTAVGSGLLNDVTGDAVTRRDTLTYMFPDTPTVTNLSYPLHISQDLSTRLLVGEANGLRATTLLKFGPVTEWQEYPYYNGATVSGYDTLTITPYAIDPDSTCELRMTFAGFSTDSSTVSLDGSIVSSDWIQSDSVTTPPPPAGTPLFTGVTPDSLVYGDLISVPLPPSALAPILSDSLSIGVTGAPGTPMHRYVSIDLQSSSYSPQLAFWVKAHVQSVLRGDVPDSLISLPLLPAMDTYRLERLVPPPQPGPDELLLAGGAPWRGYLRFNRFDVPGVTTNGVPDPHVTVNSADLQLIVGSHGYTFQPDSVQVELHELLQTFDKSAAETNSLNMSTSATRIGSYGFNTIQNRDSLGVRSFELADIMNTWWHDSTTNYGLILSVNATTNDAVDGYELEEDRRVDSIEILGVRLILTTTVPPIFAQKPAQRDSAAADPPKPKGARP